MRRIALVVEDEILIRMDICDQLREHGFTVYEAGNTADAETAMLDHGPSVVITDINLGTEGDGITFAKSVLNNSPGTAVIICSGSPPIGLPPDIRIMPKPFTCDDVLEVIDELENRRSSAGVAPTE